MSSFHEKHRLTKSIFSNTTLWFKLMINFLCQTMGFFGKTIVLSLQVDICTVILCRSVTIYTMLSARRLTDLQDHVCLHRIYPEVPYGPSLSSRIHGRYESGNNPFPKDQKEVCCHLSVLLKRQQSYPHY